MIIFYIIPGNVLLVLAAAMVLGSVVFAIWYSIMQAKEELEVMARDDLSVGKRVAVLLNVIAVFASIAAFAYGLFCHNGIAGTAGVLGWMAASLILAYTCSPLRLIYVDDSAKQGCAHILLSPLVLIMTTVSMLLIMMISWIFGLGAALRGLSKKVYWIIAGCVVLLAVAGVGLSFYQQYDEQEEAAHYFQLVEDAYTQVLGAVEAGKTEKVIFDDETALAMDYCGVKFLFSEIEIREAIANKFAQLYQKKDWDGTLELLRFLDANYSDMLEDGDIYDICFSDDYIKAFHDYIRENGVHKKTDGENEIYIYKGTELWFMTIGCYVEFTYTLDGVENTDTEILGYPGYRRKNHTEYDESSPGYFLVGEVVELVEDKIESSEDLANKYYPAATCPKCGISFRANTLRARMIANHGYCGMGLCNKD